MVAEPIHPDDEIISGINVTPLVDVVLVLLIIFMATWKEILAPGIPIELPRAATAENQARGILAVAIDQDGGVYFDGRPGRLRDLHAAVALARKKRKDPSRPLVALVSADIRASYGLFARVVDRLRVEGVSEIVMDTKPGVVEAPKP